MTRKMTAAFTACACLALVISLALGAVNKARALTVSSPRPGDTVACSFTVSGRADKPALSLLVEASIDYRSADSVTVWPDANGNWTANLTVCGPDAVKGASVKVTVDAPEGTIQFMVVLGQDCPCSCAQSPAAALSSSEPPIAK